MRNKLKKIALIFSVFIAFAFIVSGIWYWIEYNQYTSVQTTKSNYPYTLNEFFLYVIGYNDIDAENQIGKSIFSLICLLGTTLLSSIFTVSLFEFRSKLLLNKKAIIWQDTDDNKVVSFSIESKNYDLYNVVVSLNISYGIHHYQEERTITYLPKKKCLPIDFDIKVGSVPYRYLRNYFKDEISDTIMVCMVSYVDSESGTSYTICSEYSIDDIGKKSTIIFNQNPMFKNDYDGFTKDQYKNSLLACDDEFKQSIKEYILNNVVFNLCNVQAIRAENINLFTNSYHDRRGGKEDDPNANAFYAKVHFDSEIQNKDDYGMILLNYDPNFNWQYYYENNAVIMFDIFVKGPITVVFEIKGSEKKRYDKTVEELSFNATREYMHIEFNLQKISENDWSKITELCFTVFDRTLDRKGSFSVKNFEIVV